MRAALALDAVVFGGGAAGLWLLDELSRAGHRALLLEAGDLGSGQTIASQGIIHGGLKYTLSGLFTTSAKSIRDMPMIWRRCLAGEAKPDLSDTRLRAEYCHIWRTGSLKSRLAMMGAKAGLRVTPVALAADERPAILADCPGTVARLDEQVIDPASFIADLSRQSANRLIKIDARHGLEFEIAESGEVELIRLLNPESGEPLDLQPKAVILTAGAGNAPLRQMLRLSDQTMQQRPLHMVMARGPLPTLNGHCVEGSSTRLTITTTRDFDDRAVWQFGGQLAELGVSMPPAELIAYARTELREVLPGLDARNTEWATYSVDRAEARAGGQRPDDPFAGREGNIITAWPTKLALVPEMARLVMKLLAPPGQSDKADDDAEAISLWPRPIIALPPWETQTQWLQGD